jgi:DNA mismatch repair protein MutL
LILTGGVLNRQEDIAAAPGTQVEVTDLFFNIPARKKFLKTAATELAHICQVVQQAAIARPEIQFRLKHNGQDMLNYPAVVSRRDRIVQIYGTRLIEHMAGVNREWLGVRVEGMTVNALYARATRSPQELFVNRRPVKNPTISHAIYDGYGVALPKGCHPIYVLFVDIDSSRVDVNVHPTKREVRFADQELIHQTIRQAIRVATENGYTRSVKPQPGLESPVHRDSSGAAVQGWSKTLDSLQTPVQSRQARSGPTDVTLSLLMHEAVPTYLIGQVDGVIPFGQVNQTFLVAQIGTELQIVDQHTAHERILFERLWRAWKSQSVQIQPLLVPESIDPPPHAATLLQQHLGDLAKLGLDMEPFGGTCFVIRAIPALLGHVDYAGLIQDLVEDLAEWNSTTSLEARIRPVLASLACHAAIRAGRMMALPEMKRLLEDWMLEGQPATCPHGRRIALQFTSEELAKIFGR